MSSFVDNLEKLPFDDNPNTFPCLRAPFLQ